MLHLRLSLGASSTPPSTAFIDNPLIVAAVDNMQNMVILALRLLPSGIMFSGLAVHIHARLMVFSERIFEIILAHLSFVKKKKNRGDPCDLSI